MDYYNARRSKLIHSRQYRVGEKVAARDIAVLKRSSLRLLLDRGELELRDGDETVAADAAASRVNVRAS